MDIAKGSKSRELTPTGKHQARLVLIVDMGTQKGSKLYPEEKRKIRFGFEILGKKTKSGQKFVSYIEPVLSNSTKPKSKLMTILEDWLDVTDKHYNIDDALGKYATIKVSHSSDGKYDNIDSILPLNGKPVEKGTEKLVSFYMDEAPLDMDTFEGLPDWMQTKIAGSPEFAMMSERKGKKKGKK